MTNPNLDNEKKKPEVKSCLTCAHLGDDAHCESIECWDYSGWTAARYVEEWRR